jgi:dihydroflavonol-4-reductase
LRTDVFLTGATGFVGAHVLRELVAAGYRVRVLARSSDPRLAHENVDVVTGDLQEPGEFARAVDGCRYVVHCAALYSFSPSDRALVRKVNVSGTAGVLEAARVAGVERVVLTSSSATLGPCDNGRPRTEHDWATEGAASNYHHSKLEQERAAFAGQVPVIALLPTAPVGPGDWKPTPTGQMVVDFARGKMMVKPPRGGLNLVAVEDVARAHVTALQAGRAGERYILGGENLLLDDVWRLLAEITGKAMPKYRIPDPILLAMGYVDEFRCRLQKGAQPAIPLEGVRMSRERMFADSSKAQRELSFHPGPVRDALERAVRWYREHGYCN